MPPDPVFVDVCAPMPVRRLLMVHFRRSFWQNLVAGRLWQLFNLPRKWKPCLDVSRRREHLCRYWWFWC